MGQSLVEYELCSGQIDDQCLSQPQVIQSSNTQQSQAQQQVQNRSFEEYQDEIFQSDEFRMYKFKVFPCSKRYYHDWTTCAFSHIGEKAKRRDPLKYKYVAVACPDMKKVGSCVKLDSCPLAHSVFEYWLHPSRYRTQMCNQGPNCKRKVCFFAHQVDQLRTPTDDIGLQTFMENGLEYPKQPVEQLYINFDNQGLKQQQISQQIDELLAQKMDALNLQDQQSYPLRKSYELPLNPFQSHNSNQAGNTQQNSASQQAMFTSSQLNNRLDSGLQTISEQTPVIQDRQNFSSYMFQEPMLKQQEIEKQANDLNMYHTIQSKIRSGELSVQSLPPDLQDVFRRRSMDTVYTLMQRERQNQMAGYLQKEYLQRRGLSFDQQQEILRNINYTNGISLKTPYDSMAQMSVPQYQNMESAAQVNNFSSGADCQPIEDMALYEQQWYIQQLKQQQIQQQQQQAIDQSMNMNAQRNMSFPHHSFNSGWKGAELQDVVPEMKQAQKKGPSTVEMLSDFYR